MKYKLILRPSEYETLMQLMVGVMPDPGEFTQIADQPVKTLVLWLMDSLYERLHDARRQVRTFPKPEFRISVPIAEALAFQAFWTGKPMRDIVSSAVINRIIGEIDQKTKSIIF